MCELGGMGEGERCCSSFLHRLVLVGSLLVAWSVSRVSCLVCVSFTSSSLGFASWSLRSSLCRFVRERERLDWIGRERWETILLIVMLESSSRSAPRNKVHMMAYSTVLQAWRSTFIEVSCSSPIATIIECKYSRVMMARSCPSSARKATNQASSSIHGALRSITIMIASSSLIAAIIEYNHGH